MHVLLNSFHLSGQTLGFHPQAQKLDLQLYAKLTLTMRKTNRVMACESTDKEVEFELAHIEFHPDSKVTTFFYV